MVACGSVGLVAIVTVVENLCRPRAHGSLQGAAVTGICPDASGEDAWC
jgi:hypothetical protein